MTDARPIGPESFVLRWSAWIVCVTAALIFFTNLGAAGLWDEDEPRNAACSAEMLRRGDWVVPMFNGEYRCQKPVMLYWLQMASYTTFGQSEFAARVPSALLSIGTCLLTWWLGRMLHSTRVGLLAGLFLATAIMFDVAARASTPDGCLIFGVVLTMACYVRGCSTTEPGSFGHAGFYPQRWIWMALVYAAMGWSMLAKGPIGILLPTGIMGLFVLFVTTVGRPPVRQPRDESRTAWWMLTLNRVELMLREFPLATWKLRPLTGALVITLIAAPWYVLVHLRTDGVWTGRFLGFENMTRFSTPQEGHSGPIFYYVLAVLIGFFPASTFLLISLWRGGRAMWAGEESGQARRFLLCWAGVWIGAFSLAATKLPSYVLPAYPACALLTAMFLAEWQAAQRIMPLALRRAAWGTFLIVGLGMLVGLPFAADRYLPGEAMLGSIGLILVVGGIFAAIQDRRRKMRLVLGGLCTMSIAFALALWGWGSARVSEHQNSARFLAKIREVSREYVQVEPTIATYQHAESSVVYYAGTTVKRLENPVAAAQLFADHEQAFVITSWKSYEKALKSKLPPDVEVLAREPRFLKREDVVLLGRVPRIAQRFPKLTR